MTVVTNRLIDAAGRPVAGAAVTVELRGGSWVSSGAGEIVQPWSGQTDEDGLWSVDLPPQSTYEGETYYRVVELRVVWNIVVVDSESPVNIRQLVTTVRPSILAPLTLDSLADVETSAATPGQVLGLGTEGVWEPRSAVAGLDHGALTGLTDDDHTQYLTVARADTRYYTEGEVDSVVSGLAAAGHTHSGVYDPYGSVSAHEAAVDPHPGLTAVLATKSSVGHSHLADIYSAIAALATFGNSVSAAGGVETLPRINLPEIAGVSGQLWLSYFTSLVSGPITNLMIATGSVGGTGISLARLALFTVSSDGDISLAARTANDVTIGSAAYTPYQRLLSSVGGYPASYNVVAGTRYAQAFLQVASNPASVQGGSIVDGANPPVPSRTIANQSDIAVFYPAADLAPHFFLLYGRGMP